MSATGMALAGPGCSSSEMPGSSAISSIALKAATMNDDISAKEVHREQGDRGLKAGDLRGKLRCFACIFQFPPEKKAPDGAGSSTSGME
jgi:hypothetical protein